MEKGLDKGQVRGQGTHPHKKPTAHPQRR